MLRAVLLVGLLALCSAASFAQGGDVPQSVAAATDDFVITVKTDNSGASSSTQFIIPTTGAGYNYNVDCNNDNVDEATGATGDYTCDYGVTGLNTGAGTYTIRIKDNSGAKTGFPRIYFNNGGDRQKLLTIAQWGTGKWTSMASAFYGCTNLTMTATDAPDLAGVADMSYMFYGAAAFNGNIGSWDTGNVTTMGSTFAGARAFNQDIGGWNTAKVTTMSSMFNGANAFNQDIGRWNTSKVTIMIYMFYDAYAFNQDIGNWDTSNVTNMYVMFETARAFNQDIGRWNTGKVTNMSGMFWDAYAFNQDIGDWNTAKVTNMSYMFSNATAFNQNLGRWKVTALTNAANMFSGVTLSTANYDALLIGWNAQTLHSGVAFGGGKSTYCVGEAARNNMVSSAGWTITDGAKGCAGEGQCGGVGTYTFSSQSNVVINVTNAGTNLACLYVEEVSGNHPHATTGIQTGKYWMIRGLQNDGATPAAQDFLVNLTLPTTFTPDAEDKVCRYTGTGTVWDCATDSHTANTITRNGISALSDWAAGDNVAPTAVTLNFLTAEAAGAAVALDWQTASEAAVVGFDVYRATNVAGPYARVNAALIPAQGDALSGASYHFVDMPGFGAFYYQLADVRADGGVERHGPVGVQVAAAHRLHLPLVTRASDDAR